MNKDRKREIKMAISDWGVFLLILFAMIAGPSFFYLGLFFVVDLTHNLLIPTVCYFIIVIIILAFLNDIKIKKHYRYLIGEVKTKFFK